MGPFWPGIWCRFGALGNAYAVRGAPEGGPPWAPVYDYFLDRMGRQPLGALLAGGGALELAPGLFLSNPTQPWVQLHPPQSALGDRLRHIENEFI